MSGSTPLCPNCARLEARVKCWQKRWGKLRKWMQKKSTFPAEYLFALARMNRIIVEIRPNRRKP